MRNYPKMLFAALLGAMFLVGACCSNQEVIRGTITDSTTGKGIAGIAVSDGFTYTRTNARGAYSLKAEPRWLTVQYVTPSGYKVAQHKDGSPAFYAHRSDTVSSYDFVLEPLESPEDTLTLVMLSDPQCQSDHDVNRLRDESIPDLQKVLGSGIASGEYSSIYAFGLGDVIYDNLDMWDLMAKSFRSIKLEDRQVPIYNVPGNHDHFNFATSDDDALDLYTRYFGPANYSFDRGRVHFICMDDIIWTSHTKHKYPRPFANAKYDAGFTEKQLEWLRQDIAMVDEPESKMVVFLTHAPFGDGAKKGGGRVNFDKGYEGVLRSLTAFGEAHIMIGHTHHPMHFKHSQFICKGGQPVQEHVHHALCGAWWHCNICVDGAPMGYSIYRIEGASLRNYIARYVGYEPGLQMRVYDGNQVYTGAKGRIYRWEDEYKGKFIASVWNDDEYDWKVEFVASDGSVHPMSRIDHGQKDWMAVSYFINENGRGEDNASYQVKKRHYWVIDAPSGSPAREKGWKIVATQTIPTSGEVNVFECSTLQSDYKGF